MLIRQSLTKASGLKTPLSRRWQNLPRLLFNLHNRNRYRHPPQRDTKWITKFAQQTAFTCLVEDVNGVYLSMKKLRRIKKAFLSSLFCW